MQFYESILFHFTTIQTTFLYAAGGFSKATVSRTTTDKRLVDFSSLLKHAETFKYAFRSYRQELSRIAATDIFNYPIASVKQYKMTKSFTKLT